MTGGVGLLTGKCSTYKVVWREKVIRWPNKGGVTQGGPQFP